MSHSLPVSAKVSARYCMFTEYLKTKLWQQWNGIRRGRVRSTILQELYSTCEAAY